MEQPIDTTSETVERPDRLSLLILDLDGTVREPVSGNKFIQRPRDQRMIEGVEGSISYFAATGWKIVGVTEFNRTASPPMRGVGIGTAALAAFKYFDSQYTYKYIL